MVILATCSSFGRSPSPTERTHFKCRSSCNGSMIWISGCCPLCHALLLVPIPPAAPFTVVFCPAPEPLAPHSFRCPFFLSARLFLSLTAMRSHSSINWTSNSSSTLISAALDIACALRRRPRSSCAQIIAQCTILRRSSRKSCGGGICFCTGPCGCVRDRCRIVETGVAWVQELRGAPELELGLGVEVGTEGEWHL